jgi:hypothetical protein
MVAQSSHDVAFLWSSVAKAASIGCQRCAVGLSRARINKNQIFKFRETARRLTPVRVRGQKKQGFVAQHARHLNYEEIISIA